MGERIIDPATKGWAASWYEASARARLDGLLDAGSFREVVGPEQRRMSPHLPLFDLPRAFDDGMIVGSGRLDGKPVLVAAQIKDGEGQLMLDREGRLSGAGNLPPAYQSMLKEALTKCMTELTKAESEGRQTEALELLAK